MSSEFDSGLMEKMMNDEPVENKHDVKPVSEQRFSELKISSDKFKSKILKKVGLDNIPSLNQITRMAADHCEMVQIKDIGIFVGVPNEDVLSYLFQNCNVKNRININAEVSLRGIRRAALDILDDGVMYKNIGVARIEEDGALECWDGRHRLALLCLLYGPFVEVPVKVDRMTLAEAHKAVVRANENRPVSSLERADHAVFHASGGKVNQDAKDIYEKMATKKSNIGKYCSYMVVNRGEHDFSFEFSLDRKRQNGQVTTINNLVGFWKNAIPWHKEMTHVQFQQEFDKANNFVDNLVVKMKELDGFDSGQHLAVKTLSGIGKYYQNVAGASQNPMERVDDIAEIVVSLGDIGGIKASVITQKIKEEWEMK